MTFPKYSRDKIRAQGFVLVDVLLALSVSVLFVVLTTEMVYGARDLFENAKTRSELMDVYERHKGEFDDLQLGGVRRVEDESGASVVGRKVLYGNERAETRVEVLSTSTLGVPQNMEFVSINTIVEKISPGTPLCSVNLSSDHVVGSYEYLANRGRVYSPQEHHGDWLVNTIRLPIPITLPLTDIAIRNNLAYISADSAVFGDPDILVIDIGDENNPRLRSHIHTGPGIASLVVADDYIYAAAASTASQLHIVKATSPDELILASRYQLPLPYATATPPMGSAIFFDDSTILIGTEKWAGAEFVIVDVRQVDAPVHMGSLEAGSKVNEILVHNKKAYIATAGEGQLITADVADVQSPAITESFSPSGWQRQEGKSISFFEDSISFGRTAGGFNIVQDHELFKMSGPVMSRDSSGGVYGIVSDRLFEFVVSRKVGSELQVFDKTLAATTSAEIVLPSVPLSVHCDGDSLYVLSKSSPEIYKINFSQP